MSSLFSRLSAMILVLTFANVTACSAGDRANRTLPPPAVDAPMVSTNGQQTAVIAGGCFWGIQAVFQHTKGVISATSGYTPEAQRRLQNANWSAPARPVMRSREGYVRSIQNHIWPTRNDQYSYGLVGCDAAQRFSLRPLRHFSRDLCDRVFLRPLAGSASARFLPG
jgi:hypothetical protein